MIKDKNKEKEEQITPQLLIGIMSVTVIVIMCTTYYSDTITMGGLTDLLQ